MAIRHLHESAASAEKVKDKVNDSLKKQREILNEKKKNLEKIGVDTKDTGLDKDLKNNKKQTEVKKAEDQERKKAEERKRERDRQKSEDK